MLDFAKTHDFSLSDGAQELVDEGKAAYASAYVVDLSVPQRVVAVPGPVREALKMDDFGIDEELLDDDLADNDTSL